MKEPKLKTVYVCSNCGETSPRWMGRCPSCGSWNTMNEDVVAEAPKAGTAAAKQAAAARPEGVTTLTAKRLSEISMTEAELAALAVRYVLTAEELAAWDEVRAIRDEYQTSILLITHYSRILQYIKPDFVHVFANGQIVKTGGPELAEELERTGYDSVVGV